MIDAYASGPFLLASRSIPLHVQQSLRGSEFKLGEQIQLIGFQVTVVFDKTGNRDAPTMGEGAKVVPLFVCSISMPQLYRQCIWLFLQDMVENPFSLDYLFIKKDGVILHLMKKTTTKKNIK